jgi:hypothetical protein
MTSLLSLFVASATAIHYSAAIGGQANQGWSFTLPRASGSYRTTRAPKSTGRPFSTEPAGVGKHVRPVRQDVVI